MIETAVLQPRVDYGAYLYAHPLEAVKIRLAYDPLFFINNYCFLLDPDKAKIPFGLYNYQSDLIGKMLKHRFNIILKARQLGISWLVAAYSLWLAIFHAGKSILFISIREETASELLDKVKFLFDQLPDWMKPIIYKRNETLLWFGIERPDGKVEGLNSIIKSIPTSKEAGRSKSLSLLIMDEAAFIRWAEDIHTSAFPTLSNSGSAIYLSSANGMGNLFHKLWTEAKTGDNNFETTFLPWSVYPGRDAEWYEKKRRDMRLWQLQQEFPSNPEESFVQTGRPVFALDDITRMRAHIQAPIRRENELSIFRDPVYGETIMIGIDTASGRGSDYSVMQAVSLNTNEQIAELRAQLPEDVFAVKIAGYVSTLKNNRHVIAVEWEKYGARVINELEKTHRLQVWKNTKGKYWETDSISKPMMITEFEEAIRKDKTIIHSEICLNEMNTYNYDDKGSTNAASGYNDDCIISFAIAWQMRKYIGSGTFSHEAMVGLKNHIRQTIDRRGDYA